MPYTFNPFENNLDYYQASSGGTVVGPGSSVDGNADPTGNAANDNTLVINVLYQISTL